MAQEKIFSERLQSRLDLFVLLDQAKRTKKNCNAAFNSSFSTFNWLKVAKALSLLQGTCQRHH
jgi:hypothetical protein